MSRLVLRPQAEVEIAEAAVWYGNQASGLDAAFLRAVDAGFAAIQRNPLQYQMVSGELRRVGLHRFPHSLIYVVREHDIIVVACADGGPDPRRWMDRV
jgi:plasmid stabilization system protein ParE